MLNKQCCHLTPSVTSRNEQEKESEQKKSTPLLSPLTKPQCVCLLPLVLPTPPLSLALVASLYQPNLLSHHPRGQDWHLPLNQPYSPPPSPRLRTLPCRCSAHSIIPPIPPTDIYVFHGVREYCVCICVLCVGIEKKMKERDGEMGKEIVGTKPSMPFVDLRFSQLTDLHCSFA